MTTAPKPPPPKVFAPAPAVKPPPAGRPSVPSSAPKAPARTPKTFTVQPWAGENEGEKIILYSKSGRGKTTLASMAPKPVFVGFDDGARKIRHPLTGEPIMAIPACQAFQDLLDVLAQPKLFDPFETFVLDTGTKAEELAEPYCFANIMKEKGGAVKNLEGYGYGKGYKHLQDVMRMLQPGLDGLIRRGKNVIILCQEKDVVISNAEGADYLEAGPKLQHTKEYSTKQDFQEWADHVFRIDFLDTTVKAEEGAKTGKVVGTDTTRVIQIDAARHYFAKSRTLKVDGGRVSFESPTDDSLWTLMFPAKEPA